MNRSRIVLRLICFRLFGRYNVALVGKNCRPSCGGESIDINCDVEGIEQAAYGGGSRGVID